MKRKHEANVVHVTEPCDEWLSTRNKHKIKPPSPKPKRRKSNVYSGFPRQASSSLWHLTQSAPPHPLLFTATKQSTIQGFFKPAQDKNKQGKDEASQNDSSEEVETITEIEEIQDSISEGEEAQFDSDDHLSTFDPLYSSTERIVSNNDTFPSHESDVKSYIKPNKLMKDAQIREETLDTLAEAPYSQSVSVVDCLSTDIDFSEVKPTVSAPSQESVHSAGKTAKQISHLSIFKDSDSNRSLNINENSISFYKKKKSPILASRHGNKSPDLSAESLVFTQDDSWDTRLLEHIRDGRRTAKKLNSSGRNVDNKASPDEGVDFIDNSLTFTETEPYTTKSHVSREKLLKLEALFEDKDSDLFSETLDNVRPRRVSGDDMTRLGDIEYDMGNDRFHNTGRKNETGGNSLGNKPATISTNEKNYSSKTRPIKLVSGGKNDDTLDLKPCAQRSRGSLLQNKSDVEQADLYHKPLEHPAFKLVMSDDVNSLHLSSQELCPTETRATRSAKSQRPYWIPRLAENMKNSFGRHGKHVVESIKFDEYDNETDCLDNTSEDELVVKSNSLGFRNAKKSCNTLIKGYDYSSVDIENSLRFTPSQ